MSESATADARSARWWTDWAMDPWRHRRPFWRSGACVNIDDAPLSDQIDFAHGALRSTRGAAIGIAEILHDQGLVKFVGIGNIMAAVCQDGTARHMVSQNGILGHQIGRVTEFQYPWSDSAMLDDVFRRDQHPLGYQSVCGTGGTRSRVSLPPRCIATSPAVVTIRRSSCCTRPAVGTRLPSITAGGRINGA